MVSFFTFLLNLVLASAALAAPPLEHPVDRSLVNAVIYTPDQAGAVYEGYVQDTFRNLYGSFTVPTFKSDFLSVFVGMDGLTCGTGGLQAGVTFFNNGTRPNAWYMWPGDSGPQAFTDTTDLHIEPGDIIQLIVRRTSSRAGSVVIENVNKWQSILQDINRSDDALCGQDAMWIVSPSDPLANFDTFVFSQVVATTSDGMIGPEDADAHTIVPNQNFATTVAVTSSTITIQHLV